MLTVAAGLFVVLGGMDVVTAGAFKRPDALLGQGVRFICSGWSRPVPRGRIAVLWPVAIWLMVLQLVLLRKKLIYAA